MSTSPVSAQASPSLARPPILVNVHAALATGHPTDGDVVTFNHVWRAPGSNQGKNGPVKIPHGSPATPIHFHLFDQSGLRLEFEDPAEAAMWVDLIQCPDQAGNGGQITFDRRMPRELHVTDANSAACVLHYTLRFKDPAGNVYEYDPEIRNGGGGKLLIWALAAVVVASCAVIGVAALR